MQHGSKPYKTNNLSQKTNIKNYRPKDQVCTYLRSNKLKDQLSSILQWEASRLKNFGHMLSTIKFDVLIIKNIDSKSKDIIAKLRLKGFSPYTRDLLQFHLPFRTLPQNYLTSLGSSRRHIYYYLWYMIHARLSHSKSLKCMSPNYHNHVLNI